MHKIITIDATQAVKTPEDGFGFDKRGNLFIAISKNGFSKGKKALIFSFRNNSLFISLQKVKVITEYKEKNFWSLHENQEHNSLFSRILELFSRFSYKNIQKYFQKHLPVEKVLSVVLSKIYKELGKFYQKNRVNLKKHCFGDLCTKVSQTRGNFIELPL